MPSIPNLTMKTISTHQSGITEEAYVQTSSPFWEDASMSDDNNVLVGNKEIHNSENNSDVSSNDEESSGDDENSNDKENKDDDKDVVEIKVEEFVDEDPFATPNMSESLVHRFIAKFVVMFASRYVINKGTVVLIEFINKLLTIYKQDFQLPLSLPGLQCMTGFSAMTKGVKKFVVCQDCYKVYEESVSAPFHCDFVKLDKDSVQFVQDSRSLMLTINIDWFQPLNNVSHLSGAIYIAIDNLLQNKQFESENIILVRLMLSPKKPKPEEINHYLKPLVDELETLYVGMKIPTFECPSGINVCAALLMVVCYIPAAWKTSWLCDISDTKQ
ncbi:hypothetical protein PHYBLDRAFT_149840 [Phycomyces blakesleeanus NRRL 1555(-)]|uniref:Uncharacterized protein n=1 Tax=Phycomyces blakesleeanus (strain ATCC 8743b / DSM 1359 / FGSC 10004 / NBRC 33097 / NRRL 1555) TaxID=763407 RepID=A0A167KTF5_PHYB8|nr:hypothetical protein PHYBLDRAFT_149840 [Phycomyces blakesleeanus NRRL 1555(-)]OAD68829.1 hypothetical protein PHYBLDRAFT_149840 [Phycomyces blakesleeanus NRRL 1555(-)]|eukprot:XP_018286869.1 hypothetical protein PHYBLDRAFT_149840 [Phycomyces blakesleeanus NRRL 1555(-)]